MSMDRRDFLKLAGIGACLSSLGKLGDLSAQGIRKPNIILCMADDQGWGDMAYNGHPALKTPNFDDMAADGLRFDRFYAAAPVCSPTRGSVLTGRHPNRFGCFSWGRTLRPQEITLAEALRTAGYATGHFGKWHVGSVRRGSPVNPGASGFDSWLSAENYYDNDPILSREGIAVPLEGESSFIAVDAALEFIRAQADKEQPFLALVWFGSPHDPHRAADEYLEMYKGLPGNLANFYGEITGMDAAFGKLRDEIGRLGIRDNTILWYCSDNGGLPQVGATGGRGHKGQIYEGGLRVPAILEWPERIKAPRVTDVPCNTSDFYPTLLELAGVSFPDQPVLDGVSLTGLIDGTMQSRSLPMGFWDYPGGGVRTPSHVWMQQLLEAQANGDMLGELEMLRLDAGNIDSQYPEDTFPGHAAWLDWPWKLHRIQTDDEIEFELYNLENDPLEAENRLTSESARAEAMKERLNRWQVSVVRSLNGRDYI